MASNYWAKLWIETLDDPKVARLPDSMWRRFFECVLLAKELDLDGYLPPVADMAWRLRKDETSIADDMSRLALSGLAELRATEDGEKWFLPGFKGRQDKMTDAERQRRYRENNAVTRLGDVRITNRNTNRYAKVTNRNTDTDTDTETETELEGERETHKSPAFQPVPQAVQKAKARRGDVEAEPGIVAKAPAAVRLISKLTNSWPGEHLTADLVQLFGEHPNEAAMTEAVRQWGLAGYKLTNYGGIGDWYRELCADPTWTIQKRYNGKANGQPAAPPIVMKEIAPGLF